MAVQAVGLGAGLDDGEEGLGRPGWGEEDLAADGARLVDDGEAGASGGLEDSGAVRRRLAEEVPDASRRIGDGALPAAAARLGVEQGAGEVRLADVDAEHKGHSFQRLRALAGHRPSPSATER